MKNFVQMGERLELNVGTGKKSGDPVEVGGLIGVCVTDADANGNAVVATEGVFRLSVTANDGTANVAISQGDALYFDSASGKIDKNNANILFGYALEPVASGATATIEVKLAAK